MVGPTLRLSPPADQGNLDGKPLSNCMPIKFQMGVFWSRIFMSRGVAQIKVLDLPKGSGLPVLYRLVPPNQWVPVANQTSSKNVLTSCLPNYGIYQVFTPILDLPYSFGEVYVFPNPTKVGDIPTLHIEVGQSEKISTRIYDVSGDLVFETRIVDQPQVIKGKSAYEYSLDPKKFKSGVYIGVVTAEKSGKETIRKNYRFTVIK